jgi:hypothetical protein
VERTVEDCGDDAWADHDKEARIRWCQDGLDLGLIARKDCYGDAKRERQTSVNMSRCPVMGRKAGEDGVCEGVDGWNVDW